jgi:hypothetical protein
MSTYEANGSEALISNQPARSTPKSNIQLHFYLIVTTQPSHAEQTAAAPTGATDDESGATGKICI